jgi:hypothetical protein
MADKSDLSDEQWEQIKMAAIANVPIVHLAKEYGVTDNAIRQKSFRDKWPTPERVEAARMKYLLATGTKEQLVTNRNEGSEALEIIAESDESYFQRAKNSYLKGIVPQFEESMKTPENFRPQNTKDLIGHMSLITKITGHDRPQQAVQINMWGQASGTVSGPDIPLDCTEVPQDEP